MEKKIEVNMSSKDREIIIEGHKYYVERIKYKKIDGVEHEDKLIYKRFNEKEYNKYLDTIVVGLEKKVDKRELLKELLSGRTMSELRAIAKRLKQKKQVKKQNGCIGFKVGERYIQLIE